MEQRRLGRTDVEVSALCLGTMATVMITVIIIRWIDRTSRMGTRPASP